MQDTPSRHWWRVEKEEGWAELEHFLDVSYEEFVEIAASPCSSLEEEEDDDSEEEEEED